MEDFAARKVCKQLGIDRWHEAYSCRSGGPAFGAPVLRAQQLSPSNRGRK